jgi:thiol-disulfide isomerase/thioredoxin
VGFPVNEKLILAILVSSAAITGLWWAYSNQVGEDEISILLLSGECEACQACHAIAQKIEQLKSENITITFQSNHTLGSEGFSELASMYNVNKLPAIVIEGNYDGSLAGFEKRKGALVYEVPSAPYVNVSSGETRSSINITYINVSSCASCGGLEEYVHSLKTGSLGSYTEVDYQDARELIDKYEIEHVPVVLVIGCLKEIPLSIKITERVGIFPPLPPYVDTSTGTLKGQVSLMYLIDSSCTNCYSTELLDEGLKDYLKIRFESEITLDVKSSEGQEMVRKYNVEKVPTFIITGETEYYMGIFSTQYGGLKNWGTLEADGAVVFRNMTILGDIEYVELR